MPLSLMVNGQRRIFEHLASPAPLATVVEQMSLKADRVAVEHNGEIAPRANWMTTQVADDDKLEVVHFVGGGVSKLDPPDLPQGNEPPERIKERPISACRFHYT